VDYILTYANNVSVGTATVTITGTGAYTGTKSATFKIVKATPVVSVKPTASDISVGQALSASSLTGGTVSTAGSFAFTNPSTVPGSSGVFAASVTFTPSDTANWNTATITVNVNVTAAAAVGAVFSAMVGLFG
jgi:hypothetical protein